MLHATRALPALAELTPFQKAFFGFLANYEGNTRAAYEYHLNRWFQWCADHDLDPMTVERTHVALYVRYLSEGQNLKGSTVNTAFTPIKGFYRWASLEDLIDRDPVVHVRLPKARYGKKHPLDIDELRKIRRAAHELGGRHWALGELLIGHALRIGECCEIRIENFQDVESGHRVLHFRRKGDKWETVPLPPQMVAAMEDAAAGRTSGYLLTTVDGRQLHRSSATGLLYTITRHAGIGRRINPHLVRASSITAGLAGWLNTREAQWLAGHEDPRTTSRHYDLGKQNWDLHPVYIHSARLTAYAPARRSTTHQKTAATA